MTGKLDRTVGYVIGVWSYLRMSNIEPSVAGCKSQPCPFVLLQVNWETISSVDLLTTYCYNWLDHGPPFLLQRTANIGDARSITSHWMAARLALRLHGALPASDICNNIFHHPPPRVGTLLPHPFTNKNQRCNYRFEVALIALTLPADFIKYPLRLNHQSISPDLRSSQ